MRDQKSAGEKEKTKTKNSWVINVVSRVDGKRLRLGGRTEVRLADECVPESQGCQPRVMGRART